MSTLLLRLAAPLQAWGTDSKFSRRMTGREPTKSGVVGLAAAALGRRRTDEIKDLCGLRFGVRIDQPGSLVRDYHITRDDMNDRKKTKDTSAFLSERYYLADAVFLVGLDGDEKLLCEIDRALQNPVFPLFLGRRSCPPAGKLSLGLREEGLEQALKNEPWLAADWYKKRAKNEIRLEIVRDACDGENAVFGLRDTPLSFDQKHRQFTFRGTVRYGASYYPTEHDPFKDINWEDS